MLAGDEKGQERKGRMGLGEPEPSGNIHIGGLRVRGPVGRVAASIMRELLEQPAGLGLKHANKFNSRDGRSIFGSFLC